MNKSKKKMTVAAVATAGLLTLGVGLPALAATDTGSDPSSTSSAEDRRELFEERRAEAEQEFAERLAAELGLDADEVAAALETVRGELMDERAAERMAQLEERLAAAVEEGTLTQEQADTLLELAQQRAEQRAAGELDGPGGRGFGYGPGHGPGHGSGHGFGPGLPEAPSGEGSSDGTDNTAAGFTI